MKLTGTFQLTDFEEGASAHTESGNTTSIVESQIGVRSGNLYYLVDILSKTHKGSSRTIRNQLWCSGEAIASVEDYASILPMKSYPGETGFFWRIVPAAENDLKEHEKIWFHRVAYNDDPRVPVAQRFLLLDGSELVSFPADGISTELNPLRRKEIHAVHQDRGFLLFLHERSRSGAYSAIDYKKQWFLFDGRGLASNVGIGYDHPTFRDGRLLFTSSTGIVNKLGITVFEFEPGVSCLHQCLDAEGNNVCSMQHKTENGWLEFEIRVYSPDWRVLGVVPLHQSDQSESSSNFFLLSRPFGVRVDGVGYCVFYHEPRPSDWSLPREKRKPQVWMAVFQEENPTPPSLEQKVDELTEKTYDLEQKLEDWISFVKQELSRPMKVVRE